MGGRGFEAQAPLTADVVDEIFDMVKPQGNRKQRRPAPLAVN
jgi:hypothetical protein